MHARATLKITEKKDHVKDHQKRKIIRRERSCERSSEEKDHVKDHQKRKIM